MCLIASCRYPENSRNMTRAAKKKIYHRSVTVVMNTKSLKEKKEIITPTTNLTHEHLCFSLLESPPWAPPGGGGERASRTHSPFGHLILS